ncbi:MAG: hypothetical protein HY820_42860 [Acidobacteria bacterium]|nr:hypothetical protein [Acidobacteriota bacterium]
MGRLRVSLLLIPCAAFLPAQEDCYRLQRGCGELSLGASANIDPDRGRTVAPALTTAVAFGVTQHLGLFGNYAHTWLASAGTR